MVGVECQRIDGEDVLLPCLLPPVAFEGVPLGLHAAQVSSARLQQDKVLALQGR